MLTKRSVMLVAASQDVEKSDYFVTQMPKFAMQESVSQDVAKQTISAI